MSKIKAEFISEMSQITNLPQKVSRASYDAFVEVLLDTLRKDGTLTIVGLGRFDVVQVPERISRNPYKNELTTVAAHQRVVFRPGMTLKNEFKKRN